MKGTLRPGLPDGLEDAYARLSSMTGLLAQLAESGADSQLAGTFNSLFDLAESIRRELTAIINEPEKPAGRCVMSADVIGFPGTQPPPQQPQHRFLSIKYGQMPSEELLLEVWRWLNFKNKAMLYGYMTGLVEEQIRRS